MLWFIIALLFFILWLGAQSESKKQYSQGYWDGHRALGAKITDIINHPRYKKQDIEDQITAGAKRSEIPDDTAPSYVEQWTEDTGIFVEDSDDTVQEDEIGYKDAGKPVVMPVRQETPAEKERKTLRNLNTILYMASFLFIAAAATFVAAAMSGTVRIIGLIIAVALFYIVGIVLYKRSQRLRPAGIAFVGTGLAILPFIGAALTLIGGVDVGIAWLVTSVLGLVAYGYASVVLRSQVVSYLTMAFILSIATSSVAAASLPIMWYFIVLIGVSLIVSSISILRPSLVSAVFRKPIDTTAQIVTPVAMAASLVVFDRMTTGMYEVVFGVATAHYLVVWLQTRKFMYETVVRLLTQLTLLIVSYDIMQSINRDGLPVFGILWLILVLLQVMYSFLRVNVTNKKSRSAEGMWVATMLAAILIGIAFWFFSNHTWFWTTMSLLSTATVSSIAVARFRMIGWGYVGLVASMFVPFSAAHLAEGMAFYWPIILVYFGVLGAVVVRLIVLARAHWSVTAQTFLTTSIGVYMAMLIISGALSGDYVVVGWSIAITGGLVTAISYVLRQRALEIIGFIMAVVAIFLWVSQSPTEPAWRITVATLLSVAVVAVGTLIHYVRGTNRERRNNLLILGMSIFAILAVNGFAQDIVVIQTSIIILAVSTVGFLVTRWFTAHKSEYMKGIVSSGYIIYQLIAVALVTTQGADWVTAILLLSAVTFWLGSHVERVWSMTLVANIALVAAVYNAWTWLGFATEWRTTASAWIAAGIIYAVYSMYVRAGDELRQLSSIAVVWILLTVALFGYTSDVSEWIVRLAAIPTLIAGLLTVGIHASMVRGSTILRQSSLFSGSAASYLVAALLYWVVTYDAVTTGIALAVSSLFTILYSYKAHSRSSEVIGAIIGIVTVALWLGELPLEEWYLMILTLVSFVLIATGVGIHHVLRNDPERRNNLLLLALFVLGGLGLDLLTGTTTAVLQVNTVLLFVALLGSCIMRLVVRGSSVRLNSIFTTGYASYLVLVWLFAMQLGGGWLVLAYITATIIMWAASHIERMPLLTLAGNITFVAALYYLWIWQGFSDYWMVFAIVWAIAVVSYAQSWLYVRRHDQLRQQIGLVSSWVPLFGVALLYIDSDTTHEIAGAATLIAGALTVAIQGYVTKRKDIIEIAVYVATVGLQRIVFIAVPDINFVFYAHWWAIIIWLVAWWRRTDMMTRIVMGVAFITLSTGLSALIDGGIYQLLFLIEHLVLLVVGALTRRQWAVWWGVIASVLAILYFIKGYVYLWLGLLGLCLVGLVVWRLVKMNNNQSQD